MATATKKSTTKKATTKKATAKKATAKKSTTKRTPLHQRQPQQIAQDATYAFAGFGLEAVSRAKQAVAKIEELRDEVAKVANDPRAVVSSVREDAPARVEKTVDGVRSKLIAELESAVASFESTFDTRANEGRKLIEELKKDQRVNKFLDQTSNTRSQVKAALTSVTKTGQAAFDAAREQADTASSQVKGAVTSLRKSAGAATDAAEAAADEVDQAS